MVNHVGISVACYVNAARALWPPGNQKTRDPPMPLLNEPVLAMWNHLPTGRIVACHMADRGTGKHNRVSRRANAEVSAMPDAVRIRLPDWHDPLPAQRSSRLKQED